MVKSRWNLVILEYVLQSLSSRSGGKAFELKAEGEELDCDSDRKNPY